MPVRHRRRYWLPLKQNFRIRGGEVNLFRRKFGKVNNGTDSKFIIKQLLSKLLFAYTPKEEILLHYDLP